MKRHLLLLFIIQIVFESNIFNELKFCSSVIAGESESEKIVVNKKGGYLEVDALFSDPIDAIELHIHSSRNNKISRFGDISSVNPNAEALKKDKLCWDVWYPVVDVALKSGMEGVAIFDCPEQSMFTVNGMFYRERLPLKNQNVISQRKLNHWENSIYVESISCRLDSFYLRQRFKMNSPEFHHKFQLLTEYWFGHVVIYAIKSGNRIKIFDSNITVRDSVEKTSLLDEYHNKGLGRQRLLESLKETVGFLLRSQDDTPHSPTSGALNLFYDVDAATFRRPHWIWSNGPSIKLLLESGKIPEIAQGYNPNQLQKVADGIGRTTLKFQVDDEQHPANGLVTSRWKEWVGEDIENVGFQEYLSVADALFLMGWGWIPLYEETGESQYPEASQKLMSATQRLMNAFDVLPMDYMTEVNAWKNYFISEQAFGAEGFAELYLITKEIDCQALGRKYIEMLRTKLEREDGLWNKKRNIADSKAKPNPYGARPQGWAMEGLLASYRLTSSDSYVDHAKRMGAQFVRYQHPSGCWTTSINQPIDSGISEKGTALWSLLFYKLYHATREQVYLETARKALLWCLDNQYTGSDPNAYGSIVGCSSSSGVVYRKWFRMSCSYTSAFFGLAVLEELKLLDKEE